MICPHCKQETTETPEQKAERLEKQVKELQAALRAEKEHQKWWNRRSPYQPDFPKPLEIWY